MSRCPSCSADVPAGETICLDCGTELVLAALATTDAPSPARPTATPSAATAVRSCADCGESVAPDPNGMCPVCGYDFAAPLHIDEAEFLRDPPSLDQVRASRAASLNERASAPLAQQVQVPTPTPWSATAPTPPVAVPAGPVPLPADRTRTRWQNDGGAPEPGVRLDAPVLVIEGGQTVFFDGAMTAEIRLDIDQVVIGRRDPQRGHYPEIDLTHFSHIDPHISRRHARIVRRAGRWYVEDLCSNDATWLNDRSHVINGESAALGDGDRILISDAIAMRFTLGGRSL